jgi:hypothetical protein
MHPMQRVTTLTVALVALVALPVPLRADPIEITGGTVQVDPQDNGAIITFLGDNFMVRTTTGSGNFRTAIGEAWPFPAGTSLDLGGVWQTTETRAGQAIYKGVFYPELFFGFSTSGGTFVTPSVTPTGLGVQILSVPFTFSGFVTAWAGLPETEDVPVFMVNLFGGGTATAAFGGFVSRGQTFYNPAFRGADFPLQYVFSPQAAPVPEPGTMMLLGSGVVGLLGLRYRRTRRNETAAE